jgi:plasmid stabilization system protein ParE
MAEIERKEVVLTTLAQADIKSVFEFGTETFGFIAAKAFVSEVYMSIWGLDYQYNMHPECRFLTTKSKVYHNIIQGSYLIIYRITDTRIEVLRVLNSKVSIRKIRGVRGTKV